MQLRLLSIFTLITVAMPAATLQKSDFGKTPDGTPVALYTVKNSKGMEARIITYGGAIVSLKTPDRTGAMGDIVLGYDTLADYLAGKSYFGALIGRYGNRIAHGKFTLEGKSYSVPVNNGENALHGGIRGFDKRVWTARPLPDGALELTYKSADGEEGYPGNLTATVTYTLTEDNHLRIRYVGVTDKPTVLNLTNHSYFNLKRRGRRRHSRPSCHPECGPVSAGRCGPHSNRRIASRGKYSIRFPSSPHARAAASHSPMSNSGSAKATTTIGCSTAPK